jgi:hypothetical protein
MMVASSLFLVVIAMAFSFMVSLQNTEQRVDLRAQVTDQARLAIQQITEAARSALLLYTPTNSGTSLVIYTETSGIYSCAQWKVVNGSLENRTFSPTWQNDGTVSGWRVVATDVVNGTSLDPQYPSATTPIFSVASPILSVDLLTNVGGSSASNEEFQTSVTGRDVEYKVTTSACSVTPS